MSPVTWARDRDSFVVEDSDDDMLGGLDQPAPTSRRDQTVPAKPLAAAPVAAAASPRLDETMSSETQVRFDQQDALAEADFHMAYGLYDQAADLVKIAIEREPTRRDLKRAPQGLLRLGQQGPVPSMRLAGCMAPAPRRRGRGWDKCSSRAAIAPDDAMFKGEAGAAHVDSWTSTWKAARTGSTSTCSPSRRKPRASISSSPAASARRLLHPARQ
jgi:hypothetical protein